MKSSKEFINSSSAQTQQHSTMKRTLEKSAVNLFQEMTSKKDLYEHLEKELQVSESRPSANSFPVL